MMHDYFGPVAGFWARLKIATGVAILGVFATLLLIQHFTEIEISQFVVEWTLAFGAIVGIIVAIAWHYKTGFDEN